MVGQELDENSNISEVGAVEGKMYTEQKVMGRVRRWSMEDGGWRMDTETVMLCKVLRVGTG